MITLEEEKSLTKTNGINIRYRLDCSSVEDYGFSLVGELNDMFRRDILIPPFTEVHNRAKNPEYMVGNYIFSPVDGHPGMYHTKETIFSGMYVVSKLKQITNYKVSSVAPCSYQVNGFVFNQKLYVLEKDIDR